jgi:hypothetical protein
MSTTPTRNGGNEVKKKTEAELNQFVYMYLYVHVVYTHLSLKNQKQGKRGMLYPRKRSPPQCIVFSPIPIM